MKLGIGGRVGPFRVGVSTRGFGVGAGPFKLTGGYGGLVGLLVALLKLVLIAAAIALAVAAALVIGTVYGIVLVVRGTQAARGTRVGRPAALIAGGIALTLSSAALLTTAVVLGARKESTTHSDTVATRAVLPNSIGQRLDVVQAAFVRWSSSAHIQPQDWEQDLSPADRGVGAPESWTVVATSPGPGARVTSATSVVFFCLHTEEYRWFLAHPRMPKLSKVSEANALTNSDYGPAPLAAISELVNLRYPRSATPPGSYTDIPLSLTRSYGRVPHDPSIPPRAEQEVANRLAVGDGFGRPTGTIPAAGAPLRVGQMITVLTRPTN